MQSLAALSELLSYGGYFGRGAFEGWMKERFNPRKRAGGGRRKRHGDAPGYPVGDRVHFHCTALFCLRKGRSTGMPLVDKKREKHHR